ncbi:MAG: MBL fold metallo-hydrolase [Firmicutes bacterium]|nr:MBL fold metallo-hydrolase [Bacillota bacterium]
MSFKFCSFASGSSGNSYLVRSDETAIIIDAGISGKRIMEGLEYSGTAPEEVSAILVTHEHSDHVQSLKVLHKKLPEANTYSNFATWENIQDRIPEGRHVAFESGDQFTIGDIEVKSFATHHDSSESVCYSMNHDGKQITILTDTGHISEDIYNEIKGADILALEANHDPNVLAMCRYPYYVKRRILGDYGHLSNEAAAECIARLVEEDPKRRRVLLAHLSRENNSPEMALLTVRNYLGERGIFTGDELALDVLMRDEVSKIYIL